MADQILQTAQTVLRDPSVKMFLSQLSGQISRAVEEKLAALGIKPVVKAAEDVPAERPALTEEQKIKLDKAKYRMERAEKNLKEYQALKNKFFTKWFVGTSSLKAETEVEREYQMAKADYEKLKQEFGF
jgi:hypothetical protein